MSDQYYALAELAHLQTEVADLRVRCAQLERERDEAREGAQFYLRQATDAKVLRDHAERERDEARATAASRKVFVDALEQDVMLLRGQLTALQGSCHRLHEVLTRLHARIANGHVQSIGSIDNVRMVQFNADELAQLAALLTDAAPEA